MYSGARKLISIAWNQNITYKHMKEIWDSSVIGFVSENHILFMARKLVLYGILWDIFLFCLDLNSRKPYLFKTAKHKKTTKSKHVQTSVFSQYKYLLDSRLTTAGQHRSMQSERVETRPLFVAFYRTWLVQTPPLCASRGGRRPRLLRRDTIAINVAWKPLFVDTAR